MAAPPIFCRLGDSLSQMDGGHGGASGRYSRWRDVAWDYAFAADAVGATEVLARSTSSVE